MPTTTAPVRRQLAIALALDGRPKYVIAAAARIPANYISGFLSGRIDPTPAQRERLAAVLDVEDREDLFAVEVSTDAS